MKSGIKSFFKFKLGVGVVVLILAVGSFLAANGLNEVQVEDASTGNISVEFKDADINDVFRVLALKGNVNIVADPDVKGLVTVQITDVPWEKVLDVICRTYGYAYEREANIIRVTTLEKQGEENLVTEVFPLSYAKSEDVVAAIAEMKSDRGKIKADTRSNLVIVTDIPTNIYKIGKVIERLDSKTPQVTIEAKVIETAISNTQDIGLKWNASYSAHMSARPTTFPWPSDNVGKTYNNYFPKGNDLADFPSVTQPSFPLATTSDFTYGILDGTSFSLLMEAIQSKGNTKILSNPRITTLDNTEATIHVGTDWPIAEYEYKEESGRFVVSGWTYRKYGVLLNVKPTINPDGYITLKIKPEISDKVDEVTFEQSAVPVISTQTAEATVMVKDGDTLVIGGLLKDKTVTTRTKVPLLGDIPVLGLLFTHKSEEVIKNDLMIFITPHIVGDNRIVKRERIMKALESVEAADESKSKSLGKSTAAPQSVDVETPLLQSAPAAAESTPEVKSAGGDSEIDYEQILKEAESAAAEKDASSAAKPSAKEEKAAKTAPKTQDAESNNKGFLFKKK